MDASGVRSYRAQIASYVNLLPRLGPPCLTRYKGCVYKLFHILAFVHTWVVPEDTLG